MQTQKMPTEVSTLVSLKTQRKDSIKNFSVQVLDNTMNFMYYLFITSCCSFMIYLISKSL